MNRKTTDRYFNYLRGLIRSSALAERQTVQLGNGIEADESYFGPRRVRISYNALAIYGYNHIGIVQKED